jgi:hypothetical protein
MKKIYVLIILLVTVISGQGQLREWTGGNGSWTEAANWSPVGIPVQGDVVVFKNISATISNVPSITLNGLVVSESNVILNGSTPVSLKIDDAGSADGLKIEVDATLTLGNQISLSLLQTTHASIDGTLLVNNGSKMYAGSIAKIKVSGRLVNKGEIESSKESLLFKDGSVYEHVADKSRIPSATWNSNSTCLIKGVVSAYPPGLDQVFGNYTWDCEHQSAVQFSGTAIPSDIRGNLLVKKAGANGNAILMMPEKVTVGGNVEILEGNCTGLSKDVKIDLRGDLVIRGGSLRSNTSIANSTLNVKFTGQQKQTFLQTGGTTKGISFVVTNKSCLNIGDAVITGDGDFILEAGARLMTGHPEGLSTYGNHGAIQVKGNRVFSSEADYAFTGNKSQETGSGLPDKVSRLIIDNRSGVSNDGGVKLSKPTFVSQELVLLNGYLETSHDHMLTIGEQAQAGGSDQSFVTGPMRKRGSGSFIFPTGWAGNGGGRIPIGIRLIDGNNEIQAEYKRASAIEKGKTIKAPLHHINYCEFWELFPVKGSARAVITVYYNAYSNCNPVSLIQDFSSARVARSNGIAWTQIGNGEDSLDDGTGYVVSDLAGTTINAEERFYALGNITNASDPLPVMFDNVLAYEKNQGVNIEWSNLTERDIAIYYVERSHNGMDYTIIDQLLPNSNRDDKASYTSFDNSPLPGTNFYRIKVIEKSTKIIFSKILRVEMGSPGRQLSVYPNPVTNKQIMIGMIGLEEGKYDLSIINSMGQPVSRTVLQVKGHALAQPCTLPSTISPGVYTMVISGTNYRESKMFIVQ